MIESKEELTAQSVPIASLLRRPTLTETRVKKLMDTFTENS